MMKKEIQKFLLFNLSLLLILTLQSSAYFTVYILSLSFLMTTCITLSWNSSVFAKVKEYVTAFSLLESTLFDLFCNLFLILEFYAISVPFRLSCVFTEYAEGLHSPLDDKKWPSVPPLPAISVKKNPYCEHKRRLAQNPEARENPDEIERAKLRWINQVYENFYGPFLVPFGGIKHLNGTVTYPGRNAGIKEVHTLLRKMVDEV